jgi:hypothetical protein
MEFRPNTAYPEHDPRYHTGNIRATLRDLIDHLRSDLRAIDAPKAQALFETSAEILIGLDTAYQHYEQGSEAAMREPSTPAQ